MGDGRVLIFFSCEFPFTFFFRLGVDEHWIEKTNPSFFVHRTLSLFPRLSTPASDATEPFLPLREERKRNSENPRSPTSVPRKEKNDGRKRFRHPRPRRGARRRRRRERRDGVAPAHHPRRPERGKEGNVLLFAFSSLCRRKRRERDFETKKKKKVVSQCG